MPSELRPWRVLSRRDLFAVPGRLSVAVETVELPDGRVVEDYYQLDMPDFVSVVAETADGRIICLRQYRHGARRVVLTLPAGLMASDEEPLACAQRELFEETGFRCTEWQNLGTFVTSSNQRCHTAHIFVARGGVRVGEPASGDLEETRVELLTPAELWEAMRRGETGVANDVAATALGLLALQEKTGR